MRSHKARSSILGGKEGGRGVGFYGGMGEKGARQDGF